MGCRLIPAASVRKGTPITRTQGPHLVEHRAEEKVEEMDVAVNVLEVETDDGKKVAHPVRFPTPSTHVRTTSS